MFNTKVYTVGTIAESSKIYNKLIVNVLKILHL